MRLKLWVSISSPLLVLFNVDSPWSLGNYPESVQVEGAFCAGQNLFEQHNQQVEWFPLVSRCRMAADSEHVFDRDMNQIENSTREVSHVRVSIYPDGGLSRIRVYAPCDSVTDSQEEAFQRMPKL